MGKKKTISQDLPYKFDTVWQVMQKPFDWDFYMNPESQYISDLEWISPAGQNPNTGEMQQTHVVCHIDQDNHTVHLEGKSDFKKQPDHSYISIEPVDENHTKLTLHMDIYTRKNLGTKLLMKQMEKQMLQVQMDKTGEKISQLCAALEKKE